MAQITMAWHGGYSYAAPDTNSARDLEQFTSLRAAVAEFQHRASGSDRYYPCVEGSTAWLFIGTRRESLGRDCPDYTLTQGPRGGVKVERC